MSLFGAAIYFADESGTRTDYLTGTAWSPCGETPVVTVTGSCSSLDVLSAVSPRGDFRFMVHEESANATVFGEFLKRLMIGATQPVFVVVCGHRRAAPDSETPQSLQVVLPAAGMPTRRNMTLLSE